jgi:hypothetical protein
MDEGLDIRRELEVLRQLKPIEELGRVLVPGPGGSGLSNSLVIFTRSNSDQPCPSSNVTRTSTSLSPRKSSRSTEPKSANSVIFHRRQKAAMRCESMGIRAGIRFREYLANLAARALGHGTTSAYKALQSSVLIWVDLR